MTIDAYADVLAYFYSYARYDPGDATRWNLERLKALLARLDHPHQRYPSILIAGTKGKGSTAAMCESILRHAGYKTGLYTSPHLHSFRERIRLEGQLISEARLIALANKLKPYFETTPNLTAFELITCVALVAFAEAGVEAAVLEVGLGGRLDATNAVDPSVAVITSISYDHMKILGDTLTLIAGEKAGIIRPGAMVVSAPQVDEAMRKIEQVCQEKQARLVVVDREWQWETAEPDNLEGQTFTVCEQPYRLPLLGEHQVVNAVTAMAAVQQFSSLSGLPVPEEAVRTGLANVQWRGRLEILSRQPYLIVDSAMNGDSAQKLVQALERHFPGYKITFIFGASSDHPIKDMLRFFLPAAQRMFVTVSAHPRAEKPEKLAEAATELGGQVTAVSNASETLELALADLPPEGLVCAAGSLFLVADIREAWLRRNQRPLPALDPIVKQD